jgi:hypothetical protein
MMRTLGIVLFQKSWSRVSEGGAKRIGGGGWVAGREEREREKERGRGNTQSKTEQVNEGV